MLVSIGLILFFGALVSAWYLGYHSKYYSNTQCKVNLPKDYLVGLNYLLNEEPDKAVDVFIKMLEVDSNTVETHLAVGKLFRRKGEVDRAIRIHQNLIARPQLDKNYREQALYELGQDYLSAGVLDRAERIFQEVLGIKAYSIPALRALLDIYQQEKEWENAIQIANKLEMTTKNNVQPLVAHYYCELAEAAVTKGHIDECQLFLKYALEADEQCVRASLLQARMNMNRGSYRDAIKSLQRIKHQNPEFLSEAIHELVECYTALNEEEPLIHYLEKIVEEYPHFNMVKILLEKMRNFRGEAAAAAYVTKYLKKYPSIHGLHLYVNTYLDSAANLPRHDFLILQNLTKKLLADKPDYQCTLCGFSGKSLHWLCPGCKQWNSTKPLHHLEQVTD
jgi:lipopolysaccharide biosynthesis regulator YciM